MASRTSFSDSRASPENGSMSSSPPVSSASRRGKRLPTLTPQRAADVSSAPNTPHIGLQQHNEDEADVQLYDGRRDFRESRIEDAEGFILDLIVEIADQGAHQAIERLMFRRLFGHVASWSVSVLAEALVSAIAPTGDVAVDSEDAELDPVIVSLARIRAEPERFTPPKRCPADTTYQRRQVPVRVGRRVDPEMEGLLHAVEAASVRHSNSHSRPWSVTSSRPTTKSRARKKFHAAKEATYDGPQPGVPFSTAPPEVEQASTVRHRNVSPRKAMNIRAAMAHKDMESEPLHTATGVWNPLRSLDEGGAGDFGLQIDLSAGSASQDGENSSSRARGSPPPLSPSPTSSQSNHRRRPHPPGSARNSKGAKTFKFGRRDSHVEVEYEVHSPHPRLNQEELLDMSVNTRSVLPNLGSRSGWPGTAFGNFEYLESDTKSQTSGTLKQEGEGFSQDPMDQHFQDMSLSPGVKLQAGEAFKEGPELPCFASHMRKSTFTGMETCQLPTGSVEPPYSVQAPNRRGNHMQEDQTLSKGTFLTETTTAWAVAPSKARSTLPRHHGTGRHRGLFFPDDHASRHGEKDDKSEEFSAATPTPACSCSSATSLTMFRRQIKVQRPCRSCRGSSSATSPSSNAMDFHDLVRQRAFQHKPPCLPTSSSPCKRAPGVSPRRVSSAPASSPLARRNLLLHRKLQPNNTDLEHVHKVL